MGSYFEGWYFKHQRGEEMLAIIPGRADGEAFIQVITQERSFNARYPVEQYHKGKTVRIAGNHFARNQVRLKIMNNGLELTAHLRYHNLSPLKGDIMGPFQFLPMQCRHAVISMGHTVSGQARINGKDIDFTGGKGYIEGDAGRSFPKSYTWVQCNAFAKSCSIMASIAHIPFAGSWFWGCICAVLLDGEEYRLATYKGANILYRDARGFLISQGGLTLEVRFLREHVGYMLNAPEKGRMSRMIHEVPAAPAYFDFRQGGRVLFQGESPYASYESVV